MGRVLLIRGRPDAQLRRERALWVLCAGQCAVMPGDCGNAEKMLASMLDFVTIRELLHGAGARVYNLF